MQRRDEPWHDADVLERLFLDEGMTDAEIADELGCGAETVQKWRKRHGIRGTRGPSPGSTAGTSPRPASNGLARELEELAEAND